MHFAGNISLLSGIKITKVLLQIVLYILYIVNCFRRTWIPPTPSLWTPLLPWRRRQTTPRVSWTTRRYRTVSPVLFLVRGYTLWSRSVSHVRYFARVLQRFFSLLQFPNFIPYQLWPKNQRKDKGFTAGSTILLFLQCCGAEVIHFWLGLHRCPSASTAPQHCFSIHYSYQPRYRMKQNPDIW